jgi:hypothetical protein
MLTSQSKQLLNGRVIKFTIENGSSLITYADAIYQWQSNSEFRTFFIDLLKNSPFNAFRWETPPITVATAKQPFEFVLLDSPGIARAPDPRVFAEHFVTANPGGVVEFPNLGGDATLVVPCPDKPPCDFGHLAAYLQNSCEQQQHLLWKLVGAVMQRSVGSRPVWLSTAGGGVAWLHIRVDNRPKYYGYIPYRDAT